MRQLKNLSLIRKLTRSIHRLLQFILCVVVAYGFDEVQSLLTVYNARNS